MSVVGGIAEGVPAASESDRNRY